MTEEASKNNNNKKIPVHILIYFLRCYFAIVHRCSLVVFFISSFCLRGCSRCHHNQTCCYIFSCCCGFYSWWQIFCRGDLKIGRYYIFILRFLRDLSKQQDDMMNDVSLTSLWILQEFHWFFFSVKLECSQNLAVKAGSNENEHTHTHYIISAGLSISHWIRMKFISCGKLTKENVLASFFILNFSPYCTLYRKRWTFSLLLALDPPFDDIPTTSHLSISDKFDIWFNTHSKLQFNIRFHFIFLFDFCQVFFFCWQ